MARENVHPVPVLMVTLNLTRAFRVSAALRDTFGQTVIGYRSVADVVLQYAAVLERKAAEHALPQFFRGSEYDPDVLDHAVRPETVNIFRAIALEGEAKTTQARYLHRVSLLELLGLELGQKLQRGLHLDGSSSGDGGGGAHHRLARERGLAFGGRVPFARLLSFVGIKFLN